MTTDRYSLIDQIRPVIQQAILDQAPTWDVTFAAQPGTGVGVPDAALVAAQAVVDAGWGPRHDPDIPR